MFRFATVAVFALTLSGAVHAAADKPANCAATAGIVADAVHGRTGGNTQQATIKFLSSDAGGIDEKYAPAVPMLVEWIYSLPADQLTDDAAEAFEKACLAHE